MNQPTSNQSALSVEVLPGEAPLEDAPLFELRAGVACIPQHFLEFSHTRESVENILLDIGFDNNYLPFVDEDSASIFIQIGVIGFDNYKPLKEQTGRKIVYGRKWRVERNLPTSEIIQTIFLAIKKAREHEIRELFRVNWKGAKTTPFNCHHDLPMMAQNRALLQANHFPSLTVEALIDRVSFDRGCFKIVGKTQRENGDWIIDLEHVPEPSKSNKRLYFGVISFLVPSLKGRVVLYGLMNALIGRSDRYVEETFTYRGFARFSQAVDIFAISELALITRPRAQRAVQLKNSFESRFQASRYETDRTRVPQLRPSKYSDFLLRQIDQQSVVQGFLPRVDTPKQIVTENCSSNKTITTENKGASNGNY